MIKDLLKKKKHYNMQNNWVFYIFKHRLKVVIILVIYLFNLQKS